MQTPHEIIFLAEESAEGGYDARAIGHSIFTQADTLDELRAMIQDAVACHFEPEEQPPQVCALLRATDGSLIPL